MRPSIGVDVYSLLDGFCSVSIEAAIFGACLLPKTSIFLLYRMAVLFLSGTMVFLLLVEIGMMMTVLLFLSLLVLPDGRFFLFFDG
jgi:hypothetical protein